MRRLRHWNGLLSLGASIAQLRPTRNITIRHDYSMFRQKDVVEELRLSKESGTPDELDQQSECRMRHTVLRREQQKEQPMRNKELGSPRTSRRVDLEETGTQKKRSGSVKTEQ
jgi:hypothetical protein